MQDNNAPSKPRQVFGYDYETAGKGPVLWMFAIILPFLILLGTWTAFAKLNAAAIAPGEVVLNKERKTIQHLEGGLIEEILVSEGQAVRAGDPIFSIRDVQERSQLGIIYNQLASAQVLEARLIAERDQAEKPDFSTVGTLVDLPQSAIDKRIKAQVKLFNSRFKSINTKIDLIKARKASAQEEIIGLNEQVIAVKRQIELGDAELASVEVLYNKKLVTANRMMTLQRNDAELKGQFGTLKANIAQLRQAIAGSEIEIIDLKTETHNAVLDELNQVTLSIQELQNQLNQLEDRLKRTVIRAPSDGIAMDLQVHTKGAVVQPGQRIMDIVPQDDRLIIEARLNPNDIDLVTTGTEAKVVLSAYKAKKVPKLDAKVLTVSADTLQDEVTGERYFAARILVDDSIFEELKADIALYPGMPAQVFLIVGERTVADYLLAPVKDATYRAFREE